MSDLEARLSRVEDAVAALADRAAIVELTGDYCRAVAADDLDRLVDLFTDDGVLETAFPPGSGQDHAVTRGRAALRETYQGTAGMGLLPCVHNHIVELDGDRARGFCSVALRLVQAGEPYVGAGHYEDEYRKEGARWRFARRRLVLRHWVPHREGWA